MKSVKTKVIVLVLCCAIFSAAVIGGTSIYNSRRVVERDSTQSMNLMCENRAYELNSMFAMVEQSVNTLSLYASRQLTDVDRFKRDASYVEGFSGGMQGVAVNAAQNTWGAMAVYIRFNPEFTDPTSGLFCSLNQETGEFESLTPTDLSRFDPDDREHVAWYYETVKAGTGIWIAPYFNSNIHVDMISYVVPFYIKDELIGVVGMDIDFKVLRDIVTKTSVYHTGYVFLTDERAQIVYHTQLPQGTDLLEFNNGEFQQVALLLREQDTNGSELVRYTFGGEEKKAAFRSLANGMRLVLTAPNTEIDEQANALILQIGLTTVFIMAVAAVATVLFTRRLVKPLLELTQAAQKIADGDLSVSITHQSEDEVGVLAESFRQTVAHLHKHISYINELAYRDSLTGVKNKTAYLEITRQMDELTRLRRPRFGLVVLDINGLKHVNDTKGHDFGDMLIISASRIICEAFKRSPVYRIGGDEFVVLLENNDLDRYGELLDEFEKLLEHYNRDSSREFEVSVARGVAIFSEGTDLTYNDVFKRADNAMYRNKEEMKLRELRCDEEI